MSGIDVAYTNASAVRFGAIDEQPRSEWSLPSDRMDQGVRRIVTDHNAEGNWRHGT
jgi:hypothetical protein